MKLIKINTDHYVIVDENAEIKEGDWIYNAEREPSILQCVGKGSLRGWQKITHSTDIDINELYYISLQEVKELIGEMDVEMKAEEFYEFWYDKYGTSEIDTIEKKAVIHGFMGGHNQAFKNNKERKYTEKDLRKIFYVGVQLGINQELYTQLGKPLQNEEEVLDRTIKSLQPKTEWEVEIIDGKLKLK